MSELKYSVYDKFEHKDGSSIEITDTFTNKNISYDYNIKYLNTTHGINNGLACESWIDDNYTKIEPKETSDFKTIFDSLCNMVETKDKRYGNSALQPLEIFAKHHNYGSRLDEKLARVKNSDELRKNDVADIIGGLILICKDKGWNNFDDLID